MVASKDGNGTNTTNSTNTTIGQPISIAERINKNHYRETIVLERQEKPLAHVSSTLESQALFNKAMEMIKNSRYHKAVDPLKEALHIAPDNPYYLSYLGFCLAHTSEDFEAAVKLCRRAVILLPSDPILQVNLGKVYKLKGDAKGAYSVFLDAWRHNKKHPAPAAELSRMGIRKPPVIQFLSRSNPINKYLGILRSKIERFSKSKLS